MTTGGNDPLEQALRDWWNEESLDWDEQVTGITKRPLPGGPDLWDTLPEVDSKAIARAAPIIEDHLKAPFDPNLIRRGGYASVDEMVADLVPKAREAAREYNLKKRKEKVAA